MTTTIHIEIPVTVEWDYQPGEPPVTSGPADNWSPGADDELSIESITIGTMDIHSALGPAEMAAIEETLREHMLEDAAAAAEDAAEARADARAERRYEDAYERFLP